MAFQEQYPKSIDKLIHVNMICTAVFWTLSVAYFYGGENGIYCLNEEMYSIFSSSAAVCAKPVGIDSSMNDRLGFVNLHQLEKLTNANKNETWIRLGETANRHFDTLLKQVSSVFSKTFKMCIVFELLLFYLANKSQENNYK